MPFGRILSPTQQCEKERHQSGKSSQSRQDMPEAARQRRLRCRRTRHSAQARWAGELSLIVGYAFSAERSSAMRTQCRRFTQRMKQAASMAQARRGGFVEGRG